LKKIGKKIDRIKEEVNGKTVNIKEPKFNHTVL